ncbi:MAG: hypothetical protein HWE20_10095 [Gammaproteobacteria bacterium]|nr:hypothetical protein [Gammaproteobacteria bacterium]
MAIEIQEFVNPKSIMTPGAAAAVVATTSGACFATLGINIAFSLVILRFFVGSVVFHSAEFKDGKLSWSAKIFFYVLNSIIIFAMATGTHAVLDKRSPSINAFYDLNPIQSAYADDLSEKTTIKQSKPIFLDWTKTPTSNQNDRAQDSPITVQVEQAGIQFRKLLANAGVVTPEYSVTIDIDQSKLPATIESVKWELPEAYFPNQHSVEISGTEDPKLMINAWDPFIIKATIELSDGTSLQQSESVQFNQ